MDNAIQRRYVVGNTERQRTNNRQPHALATYSLTPYETTRAPDRAREGIASEPLSAT